MALNKHFMKSKNIYVQKIQMEVHSAHYKLKMKIERQLLYYIYLSILS